MRKSTIIVIAVLYVASIVIVGIFGLKALMFTEKTYVEEISFVDYVDENGVTHYMQIEGKEIKKSSDGKSFSVRLKFDELQGEFDILYKVSPREATSTANIKMTKEYDSAQSETLPDGCAVLEKQITGGYTVKFNQKGKITLLLAANDGSKKYVYLDIVAL